MEALPDYIKGQSQWATLWEKFTQLPRPEANQCAKKLVFQKDKVKLYHYVPLQEHTHKIPLLIVFALINRPYIMDLQPDRSLIRALLNAGFSIYLLDWGYPGIEDKDISLEDYVQTYLHEGVRYIQNNDQQKKINILGVCQGGTLSLCYSALFPDSVNKLITMVAGVDFHTPDNQLTTLVRYVDVESLAKKMGVIPGWMLNQMFFGLKSPVQHILKYQRALEEIDNKEKTDNFLRMEQWIYDTPNVPGRAFVQYVSLFYQQNLLIKGQFTLGDKVVNLKNITMPVFNIYAALDDIIPPSASRDLHQYINSSDYQELVFNGGHIGIYVRQNAQKEVPPAIIAWLQK